MSISPDVFAPRRKLPTISKSEFFGATLSNNCLNNSPNSTISSRGILF